MKFNLITATTATLIFLSVLGLHQTIEQLPNIHYNHIYSNSTPVNVGITWNPQYFNYSIEQEHIYTSKVSWYQPTNYNFYDIDIVNRSYTSPLYVELYLPTIGGLKQNIYSTVLLPQTTTSISNFGLSNTFYNLTLKAIDEIPNGDFTITVH